MRNACQQAEDFEQNEIEHAVNVVLFRPKYAGQEHVLGVEQQHPGEKNTNDSTYVRHKPEIFGVCVCHVEEERAERAERDQKLLQKQTMTCISLNVKKIIKFMDQLINQSID